MCEKPFQAIQVSERVYWVGAIDWSLRDFHGYLTSRGTSYNAYLVLADKVTLVDTVKAPFYQEMLSRIASVIDPSRIDYIISHHAELDHSGCLPQVAALTRPEKILTSKAGVATLAEHFELPVPTEAVIPGKPLALGQAEFTFYETKMLHWPESMFSYLEKDQVLFSQDAFGMHLASFERFTDQVPQAVLEAETAKYFANILLPYGPSVTRLLQKTESLIEKTKVIATDHGPIWRQDQRWIWERYGKWAERKTIPKVVIVFDSMWQSTAAMAQAIAEGASQKGVQVKLMRLGQNHRSDVATELLDAAALIVGSPNLNGQMFPTVADVMTYLKGLKPKNLMSAVFGSYGWSLSAVEQVQQALGEIKAEPLADPLLVKFVPKAADLARCREYGRELAEKVCARESGN